LYADFRGKFDVGLKALLEAVAKVTSLDQIRVGSKLEMETLIGPKRGAIKTMLFAWNTR
jgi:hypothetical protein